MWDLAVREKDFQAVDHMLTRYRGTVPISFRLVPARARGDGDAVASLLAEARVFENRQLQLVARYSAAYLEDLDFADSVARLDLAWRERPVNRAEAQILLGWIMVARGRLTDALREFEAAERMEGAGPVLPHKAAAVTLPFMEPTSDQLQAVRGQLERWRPALDASGSTGDVGARLRPHSRLVLLALIATREGDAEGAARYLTALDALDVPEGMDTVVAWMRTTALADLALGRGRPGDALEMLERPGPQVPLELVALPRPTHLREHGFEHARYLRALAASAIGEHDEARRWLEHGFAGSPQELAYKAPAHLELGEVLESLSEPALAARHYEAGIRMWSRADATLAPRVERARARLDALRHMLDP